MKERKKEIKGFLRLYFSRDVQIQKRKKEKEEKERKKESKK